MLDANYGRVAAVDVLKNSPSSNRLKKLCIKSLSVHTHTQYVMYKKWMCLSIMYSEIKSEQVEEDM